jgi:hypothetical protein
MIDIPTAVITRQGFTQVVANAMAGFGFPAEAPVVSELPNAMFMAGSDLTPLRQSFAKVVLTGLTTWTPKTKAKGVYPPPPITIEGKDYPTALNNMNSLFMANFWSDGLPLVPATPDRVKWILQGTDLPPDTVIAKVIPRGGIATVQNIAVNLAMAGGRPEYMPILISLVQAITDPKFQLQSVSPSTNSNFIVGVVNGPISKKLRLNSGYGLLGPDSAHPAGSIIGRAIALIMQNPGGAIPGIGAMELFGGMRVTNAIFAEDEAGLPKGWDTLSVEQGFKPGENVITAFAASSADNVNTMPGDYTEAEPAARSFLYRMANHMHAANGSLHYEQTDLRTNTPGYLLISRTFALELAKLGYDKLKVKTFLWENSKISWDDLVKLGETKASAEYTGAGPGGAAHLSKRPDQITLVVAGGLQSAHAYWMESGKNMFMVSRPIGMPSKWDELIKASEMDIGPIPVN